MTAEEVVTAELNISGFSSADVRDVLRRAVAETRCGPVWITRKDGKRIAAIVSAEDAAFLREIRRSVHEAGEEG